MSSCAKTLWEEPKPEARKQVLSTAALPDAAALTGAALPEGPASTKVTSRPGEQGRGARWLSAEARDKRGYSMLREGGCSLSISITPPLELMTPAVPSVPLLRALPSPAAPLWPWKPSITVCPLPCMWITQGAWELPNVTQGCWGQEKVTLPHVRVEGAAQGGHSAWLGSTPCPLLPLPRLCEIWCHSRSVQDVAAGNCRLHRTI